MQNVIRGAKLGLEKLCRANRCDIKKFNYRKRIYKALSHLDNCARRWLIYRRLLCHVRCGNILPKTVEISTSNV